MADGNAVKSPPVGDIPKDWFPGLQQNLKFDLPAGIVIFLIALPLSLGIAVASGAPPIAGVITGFVGGIIGGFLGGSYVTINGAAAGLIAIVFGAVVGLSDIGANGQPDLATGFRYALAVGVVCGGFQVLMGLAKMGKLSNMFPLSVVHGMLAGIGVIIIAKQIHTLLGVNFSGTMIPTILAIPSSFAGMHLPAATIGALSLLMMMFWPKLPKAVTKIVPAPMAIILVTVPLAMFFKLGPEYMVKVPLAFMESFNTPDWSKIGTGVFWKFVITYTLVASLESLLTAAAMDKMDPWKRRSDMNRELVSKGVANSISSFIGGLPMIAEVVRSSANIMNGARTRWSNIFHGTFLLLSVAFIPQILNLIPLAALAGMLVYIGSRLAHVKEFVHAARIGKEELAYMLITTFFVVAVDLLWGIIIGFIVAVIFNAIRGGLTIKANAEVVTSGDRVTLKLKGSHGFLNFVSMRGILDKLPPGKTLTIDYSGVSYMDHTVHERFHDFEGEYALTGGTVNSTGKERLVPTSQSSVSALVRA